MTTITQRRGEAGMLHLAARTAECDGVRLDLCRLAVDVATGSPVADLARHAHACAPCAAFVDDLARARRWLEECAATPRPPDVASLAGRARRALLRELAARLARDLQDDARQRPGRPREPRRADVRRVQALAGRDVLRREPWRAAIRRVLRPARRAPPGPDALTLAARLDPLGLDVALGHLALLERDGRGRVAHEEADRLLALVR